MIQVDEVFFYIVGLKQLYLIYIKGALLNNNISIHNKLNNYYLTKMFYQL